jgi:hypothetical protein
VESVVAQEGVEVLSAERVDSGLVAAAAADWDSVADLGSAGPGVAAPGRFAVELAGLHRAELARLRGRHTADARHSE